MSKRRLVITAVLAGQSQSEVARTYGVSQGWISRLMARYRAEGEAAFEPRSRAPKSSPGATPPADRRAGAAAAQAARRGRVWTPAPTPSAGTWPTTTPRPLSRATINRILVRAGAVTPDPSKRPEELLPPVRSRAAQRDAGSPTSPTTGSPTAPTDRDPDLARRLLPLRPVGHRPRPGHRPDRARHLPPSRCRHGVPASTLTDNGMVFTTRFAGGKGGRNHLEHELRERNITQKNGQPNHPQTQGKVERFQQTLKKWLRAQPPSPPRIAELQSPARRVRRASTTSADRTAPCRTTPPPRPSTPSLPEGHPEQRPQRRHPRPRPPRQDRQSRQRHPARRRPTPPHRRRPNLRPNRRHPARPGPPRHRRQRRHRRNPARPDHRPTHATTSPPADHPAPQRSSPDLQIAGPGYSDVLRHHMSAPGRDRTCDQLLRRQSLYPLSYGCDNSTVMVHPCRAGTAGAACWSADPARSARHEVARARPAALAA